MKCSSCSSKMKMKKAEHKAGVKGDKKLHKMAVKNKISESKKVGKKKK
jgi:hypothetical protein